MNRLTYEPNKRNAGTLWLSFLFLCLCAACVTAAVFAVAVRMLLFAFAAAFFIISLQLFLTGAMRRYVYTVEDGCFRIYAVAGRRRRRVCDVDIRFIRSLTRAVKGKALKARFGKPRRVYNFRKSVSKKTRAELIYSIAGDVYLAYFDTNDTFFSGLNALLSET